MNQSYQQDMPESMKLSEMMSEDVCDLLSNIRGIGETQMERYKINLRDNNVSGMVLMTCNLDELKAVSKMTFGDWEMFRQMIIVLKERELLAGSSCESIDSLHDNILAARPRFIKNRHNARAEVSVCVLSPCHRTFQFI